MPGQSLLSSDKIERGFIFRFGRSVPLSVACLAGVMLIAATAVAVYSVVPPTERPVRPIADPPAPVAISAIDLETVMLAEPAEPLETEVAASRPSAPPAEAIALAGLQDSLREILAAGSIPWVNRYESVCTYRGTLTGTCYRWSRRLVSIGAGERVSELLELYDTGWPQTYEVTLSDRRPARTYLVSSSGVDSKSSAIHEAIALLSDLVPSQRREGFDVWLRLRNDRERARQVAIQSEERRFAAEQRQAQAEAAAALAEKQLVRGVALLVAGAAVGTILLAGLLLALLAIERHTRALQEVMTQGKASAYAS